MTQLRMTLTIIVMILVSACSDLAGQPEIVATIALPPTPAPVEVDNPADLGEAIYSARCASCHGITGMGDGEVALSAGVTVPDFTIADTSVNQSIEEWTDTIRVGRIENLMPPWENSLSTEEIDAVAEFTYNLWQNPIEIVPEEIASVQGTITGQIIQGTADEAQPESVFMGLHVLDENENQVDFRTLDLVNPSEYAFEDITLQSNYTYLVTAVYNDIVFSSEKIPADGISPTLDIPMTVYEITDDPTVIAVDLMTMLLFEEGDTLVIQGFMGFTNTSDRVFRTDARVDTFAYESVQIPLPEDTVILNMEQLRQRFIVQEEGDSVTLIDSRPVVPGETHQVELVYGLPYSGKADISIVSNYPVITEPVVMIPSDSYELTGDALGLLETELFDFGSYDRYVAFPIGAGGSLNFGINRQSESALPRDVIVSGIVLVIGLAMIGLGVYSLRQQKHNLSLDDVTQTQETA
ncbi:MAG: cytochrome c [Chloroflexota bacterium]